MFASDKSLKNAMSLKMIGSGENYTRIIIKLFTHLGMLIWTVIYKHIACIAGWAKEQKSDQGKST